MKIFLDDFRKPVDCVAYMYKRIGAAIVLYKSDWIVVKNYPEFRAAVDKYKGEITHVSFDHDLADGHYHRNMQKGVINYNSADFNSDDYNKTGYHCAVYLRDAYQADGLEMPVMYVHSMNPVGAENIKNALS